MTHQPNQSDLFTNDLYQWTCSYSYFQSNKHEQPAVFEVFFRKYPFNGKYVVLGGVRAVRHFLENLVIK
jgi:nicotinate phosphoribosyltransferase